MKRTFMAKSMALFMAAAMLVGCGSKGDGMPESQGGEVQEQTEKEDSSEKEEQVVIRFAGWLEVEEATAQLFKDLMAGFEAKNPGIKVETVAIPFNNSNFAHKF